MNLGMRTIWILLVTTGFFSSGFGVQKDIGRHDYIIIDHRIARVIAFKYLRTAGTKKWKKISDEYITNTLIDFPKANNSKPIGVSCSFFNLDEDNQILVPVHSDVLEYYNLSEYVMHIPKPIWFKESLYYDYSTMQAIKLELEKN